MRARVVHKDDLPGESGRYPAPFDAELLSHGRDLGEASGSEAFGVWHETLAPGRRTSRTHAHLREEEAIYVLAGTPTLHLLEPDGVVTEEVLRAGHFVSFPAGTGLAHSLVNRSEHDVELLVVGERHPGDRCRHPEDAELEAWRVEHRADRLWPDEVVAGGTPYRVRTPRLVLAPFAPEEATGLRALLVKNHARLQAHAAAVAEPPTLDALVAELRRWRSAFDRDEGWVFGARLGGRLIGGGALHRRIGPGGVEIGGWGDVDHEGKGLAREVITALARVALGPLGFERVEAHVFEGNERAVRAVLAMGFRTDGVLRRRAGGRDLRVFSLFADELAGTPLAAVDVRAWDAAGARVV